MAKENPDYDQGEQYPDISRQWRDENYNRQGLFGIAKAKVEKGIEIGQRRVGKKIEEVGATRRGTGRAENRRGRQLRDEGQALIAAGEEARGRALIAEGNRLRQRGASLYKTGSQAKVVGRELAKVSLPLQMIIAGTWTSAVVFMASVAGLLFLFFLFTGQIVEEMLWGFTIPIINQLAMIFYGIQFAFSFLLIVGIMAQFKMTGLQPVGGKGAGAKQLALLLTALLLFVPGGPFFVPWQGIWLAVILRYPT